METLVKLKKKSLKVTLNRQNPGSPGGSDVVSVLQDTKDQRLQPATQRQRLKKINCSHHDLDSNVSVFSFNMSIRLHMPPKPPQPLGCLCK